MTDKQAQHGETFFEFRQVGAQMRVAAIDAESGIEVVVIAPLTAPKSQMQSIALAKLKRRMTQLQAQGAPAQQ